MSNLQDCRYVTLQTITGSAGHWQDMYYVALGGTQPRTKNITQLEYEWLGSLGRTEPHLNDRWYNYLKEDLGYVGSLQDMLKQFWCNGAPGLGGGGGTPDAEFLALYPDPDTYEMKGVVTGTGDLTATHADTLYAPDHEGVYQRFPANAPVWSGGRCVLTGGPGTDVVGVYADDGTGTPLPEMPYLQYYPAATNSALYSNDMTQAAWSLPFGGQRSFTEVGLTGVPNTATFLDDDLPNHSVDVRQIVAIPADTASHTIVLYIKKDMDTSRFPAITTRVPYPAPTRFETLYINTQEGEVINDAAGFAGPIECIDAGDWWKVLAQTSGDGASTSLSISIEPARTTLWGGPFEIGAVGSIIVGNAELHLNKTISEVRGLGCIFSTTAAVSVARTQYSFDPVNQNPTEAAWFYETMLSSGGNYQQLNFASQDQYLGSRFETFQRLVSKYYNGSIFPTVQNGTTDVSDVNLKTGLAYSQAETALANNRDGTWSADVADFSNYAIGAAQIIIGGTTERAHKIRNLQRYDISSYDDGKSIIDGLMA